MVNNLIAEQYTDTLFFLEKTCRSLDSLSVALRCDDPYLAFLILQAFLERFESRSWEKIQNSNDCMILGQEESIKIDEVRSVFHFSALKGSDLSRKYLVFQRLDELNVYAENGLLKLFEEPPAKSCLMATVSSWESLLPTVRSRLLKVEAPVRLHEAACFYAIPPEWRWVSKRNAKFALSILNADPAKLVDILEFARSNSLTELLETYAAFCQDKTPIVFERYFKPLKNTLGEETPESLPEREGIPEKGINAYVLKKMVEFILSEKILVFFFGEGHLQPLKDWAFRQTAQPKKQWTTRQWTVFLKGLGKTVSSLFFECYRHEISIDWEKIGYPILNRQWLQSELRVSIPKLIAWMEWMSQMGDKEWVVYHSELSLDRMIEGLEASGVEMPIRIPPKKF